MRIVCTLIAVGLSTAGCGSSLITSPSEKVAGLSPDSKALSAAKGDFEKERYERATQALSPLLRSKEVHVRELARLYLGRIKGQTDVGHGADLLLKLHRSARTSDVKVEAGYFAGVLAVRAKRCITARSLLQPVIDASQSSARRSEAALTLSACEKGAQALDLLSIALEHSTHRDAAQAVASALLKKMPTSTLSAAISKLAGSRLAKLAASVIVNRKDSSVTLESLRAAQDQLGQTSPESPGGETRGGDPSVTVILPLSGRARRVGEYLKADFEAWARKLSEDRIRPAQIQFVDGSDAESIDTAYRQLVGRGETAVVGWFTSETAPLAVQAARDHDIATLMLTSSQVALRDDAPTWRIMHSPLNIARVVAGAALDRGAQRLLTIRDDSPYAKKQTLWLKRVWAAAGQSTFHELVGSPKEYPQLAAEAAALDFDAVFLPFKSAGDGAQLLRFLAQRGIWTRDVTQKKTGEKERREALVFGPPEWYTPRALQRLGRYGHGAYLAVPFAGESAQGEPLKKQMEGHINPKRLPLFALTLDAVNTLRKLSIRSKRDEIPIKDLLASHTYKGVSVGFNFANKDAVNNLFVIKITPEGFRLADDN